MQLLAQKITSSWMTMMPTCSAFCTFSVSVCLGKEGSGVGDLRSSQWLSTTHVSANVCTKLWQGASREKGICIFH